MSTSSQSPGPIFWIGESTSAAKGLESVHGKIAGEKLLFAMVYLWLIYGESMVNGN